MEPRPIPQHWQEIMDRRGISSIRQLAARAGLSHPPVLKLVHGDAKKTNTETLVKVADALNIPLKDVYWLAGHDVPTAEVWTPPAVANLMTRQQREVVEDLIRVMVSPAQPVEGVRRKP